MEEILASIRRIIAEDGEVAAAPAAAPLPAAEPPQAARQEEILELTESVAEDGTVVSLAPGGAMRPPDALVPAQPDSAAAEGQEEPLALAPAAEEQPEPVPDPPLLRLRSAATVARRAAPDAVEPPPAPPAPVAAPRAEAPSAPEPPPRPAPVAPPEPAAAPPPMVGDRLVSMATAAASVAALSQLADLGQRGQVGTTPLGEAGRTLESLVRELLRPMLRDWMDANLTPLVERLVREEIQRLARDAQTR